MNPFDGNVVNLALPKIGVSLHAQLSFLVWILASYLLVSASFQATLGWLGDVSGKKRIFAFGLILFVVGSFLASLSNNILVLIANRVVQGVGAASMSSTSTAIVTDAFKGDRGRALGINVTATYIGLTLGPIAGGFLVQTLGWRSIFYVNIPVGIASLLLALLYIPNDSTKVKAHIDFDLVGAISLSIFLASLMLSLSQSELALQQNIALAFVIICVVSLFAFILNESKYAKKPIIDLRLFTRNRLFASGNTTSIFNYLTFGGTVFVLPIYLELVRGYTPIAAGLILFAQPIVQTLTAPIAGVLSDRFEARLLCAVGLFSRAVGLFALSFLGLSSPAWQIWVPLIFTGFGHGLFSPPNTNSIMSSVTVEKRGIASGIMGTFRTASNSAGVIVMGAIIAASMPAGTFAGMSTGGTAAQGLGGLFVTGMHYTFLFAAAFSVIGIFTSLIRGKENR